MAHVVDTRSAGGDFVILGKTLVPPHNDLEIEVGAEPMTASIRYNPNAQMIRPDNGMLVKGTLEIYMPVPGKAGVWQWERIGIDRDTSYVMYTSGATMSGDLIMRALEPGAHNPQILLAKGSEQLPGIAFDLDHSTGTYYVPAVPPIGNLAGNASSFRTSVDGYNITTANASSLTVNGDFFARTVTTPLLTADVARIDRLYGNYAYIEDLHANTITANVGNIAHVISNLVDVFPVVGDDPDAIAEVLLIARGQEWVMAHGPALHYLTFNFQGRNVMTLTPDDRVIIDNGEFRKINVDTLYGNTVYIQNSLTVANSYADVVHARQIFASESITAPEFSAQNLTASNSVVAPELLGTTLHAQDAYLSNSVNTANLFSANVTTLDAYVANGAVANTFVGYEAFISNAVQSNAVIAATFITHKTSAAERYQADTFYEPGTVLVIGGSQEVTVTDEQGSLAVAGVIPNDPGYRMNDAAGDNAAWPLVALTGRVHCKVTGPVAKGDILVTSPVPGHAMAAPNPATVPAAAIIGKALEENPADRLIGKILIKV